MSWLFESEIRLWLAPLQYVLELTKQPDTSLVYRITSPSKRSYIGVTSNLFHRLYNHQKSKYPIGNSLRKYGLQNHTVEVLAVLPTSAAFELERASIRAFNTLVPVGLNRTTGGEGAKGLLLEDKEMGRVKRIGRPIHPNTKAALLKAHLGRKISPESLVRRKATIASRNYPKRIVSVETRERMSKAHTGKIRSAEARLAMSKAALGKPKSASHCAAISRARRHVF